MQCLDHTASKGLQWFYGLSLDFSSPNWGCIRWSWATASTTLSASWRRELERWPLITFLRKQQLGFAGETWLRGRLYHMCKFGLLYFNSTFHNCCLLNSAFMVGMHGVTFVNIIKYLCLLRCSNDNICMAHDYLGCFVISSSIVTSGGSCAQNNYSKGFGPRIFSCVFSSCLLSTGLPLHGSLQFAKQGWQWRTEYLYYE